MKHFFQLIQVSVTSFFIYSCSAGSGGPAVLSTSEKEIPDASTVVSIKTLQLNSEQIFCGGSFSSELADNKMNIKVDFKNNKTYNVVYTFYDSSCTSSGTLGNIIANYSFNGDYAVTSAEGNVIMTVRDSKMTIFAADYPLATRKMIDWMNSCTNMEGSFSHSENTTLSLALGPKCNAHVERAFPFTARGSSTETSEEAISRFVDIK